MDVGWVVPIVVSLGIGALIGIEREQSESAGSFAGIRTFPLIALLGTLTYTFFPDVLPVVFGMFLIMVIVGYLSKIVIEGDHGMTTAIASVLTFMFGAMTVHSDEGLTLAIVLGTLTAALLAIKDPMHDLADRIGRDELRAAIKFLIVALVILPLLPDAELGVLYGLNPRFVWLMVVFVSGLGFLGYVLTKILGPRMGIGLTGLLGGFVSSTATTMAMAEQSRREPELTRISAFATAIASIAMFPRVLILVAVVAPELVVTLLLPLGAMTVAGGAASLALLVRIHTDRTPQVDLDNPFRLRPALVFGALFAIVLLAVDLLNVLFGDAGVYGSAALAGTVDANAITLTLSKLAVDSDVLGTVAVGGITIAVVVNTVVKILIAGAFGTRQLVHIVGGILGLTAAVGISVVILL